MPMHLKIVKNDPGFLPQRGRGDAPLPGAVCPLGGFSPSQIWSENNRKISITIDFVPGEKILEESQDLVLKMTPENRSTKA